MRPGGPKPHHVLGPKLRMSEPLGDGVCHSSGRLVQHYRDLEVAGGRFGAAAAICQASRSTNQPIPAAALAVAANCRYPSTRWHVKLDVLGEVGGGRRSS